MAWDNNDGVRIKFGTEQATASLAGEYRTVAAMREVEFIIDLANLTETETVLDDNVMIPAGVRIAEIKIITTTAAATGTAIDLGLIRLDRTTELDYNGLLAAFPTASMNAAGETVIIVDNTTYDGALVGTTLANVGYVTASRTDATAFTAGRIVVTVKYYRP